MPFDFEAVAWEDIHGDRYDGKPSDLDETAGMLVHCYDEQTGQHEHFWAFYYDTFESWDDWIVYITAIMDMYGMEIT